MCQSLLLVVVGFTFSDDRVPEGFEAHWDDWLGESADSVEDWRSGPFHEHLRYGLWMSNCWNLKKEGGLVPFCFCFE